MIGEAARNGDGKLVGAPISYSTIPEISGHTYQIWVAWGPGHEGDPKVNNRDEVMFRHTGTPSIARVVVGTRPRGKLLWEDVAHLVLVHGDATSISIFHWWHTIRTHGR